MVGVPDPKYGEEICAWIKLHAGAAARRPRRSASFCQGQIAHYKIPRYIEFVDEFPMTVTGKIQKFVMRETMIDKLGLKEIERITTSAGPVPQKPTTADVQREERKSGGRYSGRRRAARSRDDVFACLSAAHHHRSRAAACPTRCAVVALARCSSRARSRMRGVKASRSSRSVRLRPRSSGATRTGATCCRAERTAVAALSIGRLAVPTQAQVDDRHQQQHQRHGGNEPGDDGDCERRLHRRSGADSERKRQ